MAGALDWDATMGNRDADEMARPAERRMIWRGEALPFSILEALCLPLTITPDTRILVALNRDSATMAYFGFGTLECACRV